MTNLRSVELGVCAWMDDQILSKCSGLSKWMMGIVVMQAPMYVDRMYHQYKGMLIDLGIATEDDRIDIDKAEEMLIGVAAKYGKVTQSFAGVNITMDEDDIRKVATHIRTI